MALAPFLLLAIALPAGGFASAADFDGDGRDDLVVSAYREGLTAPDADEGTVHVVYGAKRKLPTRRGLEINQAKSWLGSNGPRPGEQFGQSLAAGDFNGDGRDDLVIGNVFEAVEVAEGVEFDAGALNVVYGGRKGLRKRKTQEFDQSSLGGRETPEFSDEFGRTLAAGDFDRDGFEDLAVGAPTESLGGDFELGFIGVVHIVPGGKRGLRGNRAWVIRPTDPGLSSKLDPDQLRRFGVSLAAGNFDGRRGEDLAVGTLDSVGGPNTGALHVLIAARRGLRIERARTRYITPISPGLEPAVDLTPSSFASTLASGDFDGDGRDDLAAGAPDTDTGDDLRAGSLRVFSGSRRGITLRGDRYFYPEMEGLDPGEPRSGRWSFALAAGDLDNDGRDDLAVGTETSFQQVECIGGVHVLFGGRAGIGLAGNQAITQETVGIRGDGEGRRCDHFGYSLGIANLNGQGPEELMVGEPQHRRAAVEDTYGVGGLHLLYPNRRRDLTAHGYRFLTQDSRGVRSDGAETRDAFGAYQLVG